MFLPLTVVEPCFTAFQCYRYAVCSYMCTCVCFRLHWSASCGKCQPHWVCSKLALVQSPFRDLPDIWPADRTQELCQDDLLEQIWRKDSICKQFLVFFVFLFLNYFNTHWVKPSDSCFDPPRKAWVLKLKTHKDAFVRCIKSNLVSVHYKLQCSSVTVQWAHCLLHSPLPHVSPSKNTF